MRIEDTFGINESVILVRGSRVQRVVFGISVNGVRLGDSGHSEVIETFYYKWERMRALRAVPRPCFFTN